MDNDNDMIQDIAHAAYSAYDKANAAYSLAVDFAANSISQKDVISKIEKHNELVDSCDIDPEDYIEISHNIMSNYDNDIAVVSRSIKFKDLCTAIAKQLVKNDLDIKDDTNDDN